MGQFGDKDRIIVDLAPISAAGATDAVIYMFPVSLGATYQLTEASCIWATASTSGTVRPRVIRASSTEAPGATASATCIELAASQSTAGTANTNNNLTVVGGNTIFGGDKIALDWGGTVTNLVNLCMTLTFDAVQYRP